MMLQTEYEIKIWLDQMKIEHYTINDDLTVDVKGDVNLIKKGLNFIPVQFRRIGGEFNCSKNNLKSLEGCPQIVEKSFFCEKNELTTLRGCPQIIGWNFWCYYNKILSLKSEDLPLTLGRNFMFVQKLQISELKSLYLSNEQIMCSLQELKKTLNTYEFNQKLQLELNPKSANLAKKSKI